MGDKRLILFSGIELEMQLGLEPRLESGLGMHEFSRCLKLGTLSL